MIKVTFAMVKSSALCVGRLLTSASTIRSALLCRTTRVCGMRHVSCFVPSSTSALFLKVTEIVHTRRLLGIFTRGCPTSRLCVRVRKSRTVRRGGNCCAMQSNFYFHREMPRGGCRACALSNFAQLLLRTRRPCVDLVLG